MDFLPYLFIPQRGRQEDEEPVVCAALLKVAAGVSLGPAESVLVVRDSLGSVTLRRPEAFSLANDTSAPSGPGYWDFKELLYGLAPGDYEAVWEIDGRASNAARFSVGDDHSSDATRALLLDSITPRPLDYRVGVPYEPDLLMRLSNRGSAAIDFPGGLFQSRLFVDEVPFTHTATTWDGWATLEPRESVWRFLSFDEYQAVLPSGRHRLQLEFASELSNHVTIEVA